MFGIAWTTPLGALDLFLGALTFLLLIRSRSLRAYWPLLVVSLWQLLPYLFFLWLRAYRVFSARQAYDLYFYVYWGTYACSAICSALLTYTIFHEMLRPLKGLQGLGVIMYRWVCGITLAVCASMMVQPTTPDAPHWQVVVSQLQRLSGIAGLALLLFVVFTIRPLGLSFRSRNFGVSFGLAVATIVNIFTAGFIHVTDIHNWISSTITIADCFAQMIWIWYFAVPEPTRRFTLLPTTSPFHQWNLVSERMGYDPGYVAIGGVPPQSFAPAELDIFSRIAEQNSNGGLPQGEASSGPALPAGTTAATVDATERFARSWNFRQSSREYEIK